MNTSVSPYRRFRQRGMGATIILFTIALIVLVGAALAYGSRGNSKAFTGESAKVMSSLLLKQSAEHRDAYNRYIFDGGKASLAELTVTADVGLFDPNKSYGIKQDPPLKAFDEPVPATPPIWLMSRAVNIPGVGTGTAATVAFVSGLKIEVCSQINLQLYGLASIPTESLTLTGSALSGTMSSASSGRYTGCVAFGTTPNYLFYSTLSEN